MSVETDAKERKPADDIVVAERRLQEVARKVANKYLAEVRLLQETDERFVANVSCKGADFVFTH